MDYTKACNYAEDKLQGLSKHLTYHNAWHTMGDVLPVSLCLAKPFNLPEEDLLLLQTAALFHDLGYLDQYDNNEVIAVKMVAEFLPQCGYKTKQIAMIKQIIFATQMPQKPMSILEKIICDADLDSLCRDDFFDLSERLRQELSFFKQPINKIKWLNIQLTFLENHSYHTDVDIQSRKKGKLNNIILLKNRIRELGYYAK